MLGIDILGRDISRWYNRGVCSTAGIRYFVKDSKYYCVVYPLLV